MYYLVGKIGLRYIGLTDLQSVWGLIAWVSCESLTTVALKEIVTVFYVGILGIPNL